MALSDRLVARLEHLRQRHEELSHELSDPERIADRDGFTRARREFSELEPVVRAVAERDALLATIADAEALAADADPELRELARDELDQAREALARNEAALQLLLLPTDPDDAANAFLEIRAGTGGDEAALFAGDLLRMYARYAERVGWRLEILSERPGEHGGYREVITRVAGDGVYARLKFESGTHRVQRVPQTESQGRIHTSACTVAILPEPEDIEAIEIDRGDLRIDTFRSSGAGGQHVNTTDSAVRITHLPSGLVVECQDERSQHKNRARAMALLQARLLDAARSGAHAERAESRRLQVGSGDRSERIRTYNFPQGRLTDHRINLTLHALGDVIEGDLDAVIDPLLQEDRAERLAELGREVNDRPDPVTVASLLDASIRAIAGESPRLDAELLLAAATGWTRTRLVAFPEACPDSAAQAAFAALVRRRVAGEPVAHLLGQRGFWTLDLRVTPDVLVPRPETEMLVELALEWDLPAGAHVVDAGTGSGAIAIAIACERPDLAITATDVSAAALAVAVENGARAAPGRIAWRETSWLDAIDAPVDAVLSNPPYIESADPVLAVPPLTYEPRGALDGGADGLDSIRALLSSAAPRLVPGGRIAIEHGRDQGAAVRALLDAAGYRRIDTRQDAAGLDRVTYAEASGNRT